jgi:hypothetical protein
MNSPSPLTPLDRIAQQLHFAQARNRDQMAVTRADIEYLLAQLQSQVNTAYKGETPPA